MRKTLLLLASVLALSASGAAAEEDSCANGYSVCMDRCASMSVTGIQSKCSQACEARSNTCYEKVYGAPRSNPLQQAKELPPEVEKAMAKTDGEAAAVPVPEAKPEPADAKK